MATLQSPVSAINFRPEVELIRQADDRLAGAEGYGLERLVAQIYEERSRRGLGDFRLTKHIHGYWDRNDNERAELRASGTIPQDLHDLTMGL